MDEYFCPNCGAILNNQSGFDPDYGTWTCKECGQHLMDDDVYEGDAYEGVAWYCDNCGALLNRQSGFTDSGDSWRCTSCGYRNGTTEDDIINYNDYARHDGDDDDDDDDDDTYSGSGQASISTIIDDIWDAGAAINALEEAKRREQARINKEKRRAWRTKHRTGILILVLLSIVALASLVGYYEYEKMIPIGSSSASLEGQKYTEVVQTLKEAGFSNIYTKEISDLTISRDDEEDLVSEVKLVFGDSFDENTKYPSNLWITVVYHTVELYRPPLTSKDAKGMNYLDVIEEFEDIGFINVTTEVEYDIITGWLTDDGEVKSVTIDSEKNYDYYDEYRLDAEVVITYHAMKKNQ